MLFGATRVALFQDGEGLGELLDLDQHRGLHLVGQDLLRIGLDRLGEIGQGVVPFLGFRLHQAAGTQHHGVAGQGANGLVEIGQPLPDVAPQGSPPHQGLGPQRCVVVGQRDRLVEGFQRLLRIAAGQEVQLGDLELGLRLLRAELHAFFQVGQGLAAVSFPIASSVAAWAPCRENSTVGLACRQAAALHQGRGHQVVGKGRIALVEALLQRAFAELDHLRDIVRQSGRRVSAG